MKKISILFVIMLMTLSCGVSDERIDAYKRAAKKVKKADSSETLELIAYDLSKELNEIELSNISLPQVKASALNGDEHSRKLLDAIIKARRMFNETLSDKEKIFYMERLSKKQEK